jgi:hypothetical protein
MSGLKLRISRRGRLSLLATFMLLIAMVIAAPGVSSARAAVKQFKASIAPSTAFGQTSGSWTETVTNCGGSPLPAACTVSSTINLGTIQIAVPTEFRPITSVTASSPSGQTTRNWTVSYDSGTGTINGYANQGTDKLQPGESVLITFGATPSTCTTGTKTFTTSAWGSTPTPGTDPFSIVPPQPTVTITGCGVTNGGTVTGPNGQTETVGGGFTGHVIVTFGGNLSCSGDPQWDAGYHLPTQVTITPADDYVAGSGPKISTSTFDFPTGDSSFFRICYSLNPDATTGFILPPCYPGDGAALIEPPCVDKQYRDFTTNKIVITVLVPKDDPAKH